MIWFVVASKWAPVCVSMVLFYVFAPQSRLESRIQSYSGHWRTIESCKSAQILHNVCPQDLTLGGILCLHTISYAFEAHSESTFQLVWVFWYVLSSPVAWSSLRSFAWVLDTEAAPLVCVEPKKSWMYESIWKSVSDSQVGVSHSSDGFQLASQVFFASWALGVPLSVPVAVFLISTSKVPCVW